MPDAHRQSPPPHCPVNGLNCDGTAWYKYHVNSRAFSSRWLGSEPLKPREWQGRLSEPSCAMPLVLCDAPSGTPWWDEPLEWQVPREVSPGLPAVLTLQNCSAPFSHVAHSFISAPLTLPKNLLEPSLATCIKLNRLFAAFYLPVAGPLLKTEAHQTISLLGSHKSAEWWHISNLITRKQNWYIFSPSVIKKYFFWV